MAIKFTHAHDDVEANGKTRKANNLSIPHSIPLRTLVEVAYPESDYYGVRAFVVRHTRDCDGTPLYGIAIDMGVIEDIKIFRDAKNEASRQVLLERALASISSGWTDDCLTVIREAPADDA